MTFPNYPEKHSRPTLLQAEDIVAYRARLGHMPDLRSMQGVLFCLERGLPDRLHRRIPVRRLGSMNADVYAVKNRKAAVLTSFGGGAPMVVELAEELVAMGARRLLLMTWGGTLQKDLKAGDIVVINQAIRDEGTSHHYLPSGKYVQADEDLVQRLSRAIHEHGAACSVGTTWTTDAPYRETREEVQQYQAEGVKTVEMEAAGLFTVGKVRGIPAAAVVVVMDSLASYEWKVPEKLDDIQRSLEIVYAASIDVLEGEA